jgi:hypothetical protein
LLPENPHFEGITSIGPIPKTVGFKHITFSVGFHELLDQIEPKEFATNALVWIMVGFLTPMLSDHSPPGGTGCHFVVDSA